MTIGADAKSLIDGAETALTGVYRQAHVPDDAAFPYGSFFDPLADTVALSGDGQTLARRRFLQVDVWQDETTEDDDLVDDVIAALDGQTAGGHHFRVIDSVLVPGPEEDQDIVHHAITVSTVRVQ